MVATTTNFERAVRELGPVFAERAARYDDADRFVAENYQALRDMRLFSALVPTELGGGGATHREMCHLLRELATFCSSTALALSMHQHLVAAQVWNYRHDQPGRALLERVAANELILVSTGAGDWMASTGSMERVDGGYRVRARKPFASGSPMGDVLLTSAPYEDPTEGWQVLHFPVSLKAAGVRIEDDWRTMGMRATGSNTVVLEDVFVPDEAISVRRPRGEYHPLWNVVLTAALPLISSVYLGVADAAAALARREATARRHEPELPILVGEMENALTTASVALESMIAIANDLDVEPDIATANAMLMRKTIATRAALETAEKALQVFGGSGFYRARGIERLVRDAHAGPLHQLPEKQQQWFTGRLALGLSPIDPATAHVPAGTRGATTAPSPSV